MGSPPLPDEARRAAKVIHRAGIVVGIHSYNDERTIGRVLCAAYAGLAKYSPEFTAAVINWDGGPADNRREAVLSARVDDRHLMLPSTPLLAEHRLLIRPILLDGVDFVAPNHQRHKCGGTIVYPLTRMLYGVSAHQPFGREFRPSSRLLRRCLDCHDWETDVTRLGVDIWMTTISVAEGFRACQSFLGATLQEVVILSLMRELVQAYRCAGEELGEVCEPTPAKRTLAAVRRFGNSLKERCETFHLVDEPWAEV